MEANSLAGAAGESGGEVEDGPPQAVRHAGRQLPDDGPDDGRGGRDFQSGEQVGEGGGGLQFPQHLPGMRRRRKVISSEASAAGGSAGRAKC